VSCRWVERKRVWLSGEEGADNGGGGENKIATGMKKGRIHVWKTNQTQPPSDRLQRYSSSINSINRPTDAHSHLVSTVVVAVVAVVAVSRRHEECRRTDPAAGRWMDTQTADNSHPASQDTNSHSAPEPRIPASTQPPLTGAYGSVGWSYNPVVDTAWTCQ